MVYIIGAVIIFIWSLYLCLELFSRKWIISSRVLLFLSLVFPCFVGIYYWIHHAGITDAFSWSDQFMLSLRSFSMDGWLLLILGVLYFGSLLAATGMMLKDWIEKRRQKSGITFSQLKKNL